MKSAAAALPIGAAAWFNAPVFSRAQIDLLKYAALLLMTVDHLAFLPQMSDAFSEAVAYISRPVFPVFAFFVTYHFVYHTKSKIAYLLRILAFAFIAEGPYQQLRALGGESVWYLGNILFSLALGVAVLLWVEWLQNFPDVPFFRRHKGRNLLPAKWLAAMLGACLFFAASLFVDYLMFGPAMMIAYYLWLTRPSEATRNAALFFTFVLNLPSGVAYAMAGLTFFVLAAVLATVHEKRLQWVPKPKRWFMYAFYPLHILLILLIGVSI